MTRLSTLQPAGSELILFRERVVDSLCQRLGVHTPASGRPARQVDHLSAIDVAKKCLWATFGIEPRGVPEEIARAAMGDQSAIYQVLGMSGAYQTPGDFPNILAGLASRVLEATPPYQGTTFQDWAYRKASVPDRRPTTLLRIGEFGELPLHVDGDTFRQSATKEEYSWIQADEYADSFGLSPMMIEHDELGAFVEALRDKQQAHDMTLNRLCINLLVGNVTLPDGTPLFDASRNNVVAVGSGGAPSTAQLSAMRKTLRKQKGVSGVRKLNYQIRRILLPEDLETVTEQLLAPTMQVVPITEATAKSILTGQGQASEAYDKFRKELPSVEAAKPFYLQQREAIQSGHLQETGRLDRSSKATTENILTSDQRKAQIAVVHKNWKELMHETGQDFITNEFATMGTNPEQLRDYVTTLEGRAKTLREGPIQLEGHGGFGQMVNVPKGPQKHIAPTVPELKQAEAIEVLVDELKQKMADPKSAQYIPPGIERSNRVPATNQAAPPTGHGAQVASPVAAQLASIERWNPLGKSEPGSLERWNPVPETNPARSGATHSAQAAAPVSVQVAGGSELIQAAGAMKDAAREMTSAAQGLRQPSRPTLDRGPGYDPGRRAIA